MNKLNITKSTDELKQLISDNPDLPIVVLAGENASSDEFNLTYCSSVHFEIGEILDCELPFESDYVFADREEFDIALGDYLVYLPECKDLSTEDFEIYCGKKLKEYDPYWKKVIAIIVDN